MPLRNVILSSNQLRKILIIIPEYRLGDIKTPVTKHYSGSIGIRDTQIEKVVLKGIKFIET